MLYLKDYAIILSFQEFKSFMADIMSKQKMNKWN